MAEYEYLVFDLLTNTLQGQLPLSGVSYGRTLNGAGRMNANLQLGQTTSYGADLDASMMSLLLPWKHCIYVVRDGTIVWGGILWDLGEYDSLTRIQPIVCAGHWTYIQKRRLRVTRSYTNVDQFDAIRDLISWVQSTPSGNIGLNVSTNLSGVLRTEKFEHYERRVVAEIVEQWSKTDTGFDFAIDVTGSPAAPVLTLNLANVRGRNVFQTNLVFEVGKNVGSYRFPVAGSKGGTSIDVIGKGEGTDVAIGTQTNSYLISQGYPQIDELISYKQISDVSVLNSRGKAWLTSKGQPVTAATLVDVTPNGDPPLGSWIVGDYARWRIPGDERFPRKPDGSPGLDRYFRIVADTVNVSDEGLETVDIVGEVI